MSPVELIGDDEMILRRIPPSVLGMDSTKDIKPSGRRATSCRLSTKQGEFGLSCTRACITSPRQLLDGLTAMGMSKEGWMVCRLLVRHIRQIGLDVVYKPTEADPGHCEIVGNGVNLAFPNQYASKLAKHSLILEENELLSCNSGE